MACESRCRSQAVLPTGLRSVTSIFFQAKRSVSHNLLLISTHSSAPDWSFRSLFDRSIDNRCPVARSSTVNVELPVEEAYSLEPSPSSTDDGIGRYNLNVDGNFLFIFLSSRSFRHAQLGHLPSDIAMRWPSEFQYRRCQPQATFAQLTHSFLRSAGISKRAAGFSGPATHTNGS